MKTKLLRNLNDVCLFVQDFDGSVKFYEEKLGFKIVRRQPGYVEFDFNGTSVTLWDEAGVYTAIPKEELGGPGNHFMLAVKVPELQDVDDICDELRQRGVDFISEPKLLNGDPGLLILKITAGISGKFLRGKRATVPVFFKDINI